MEYLKFCEDIESIFTTNHLEKTPLETVQPFTLPDECNIKNLPSEAEVSALGCLERIAEQVSEQICGCLENGLHPI